MASRMRGSVGGQRIRKAATRNEPSRLRRELMNPRNWLMLTFASLLWLSMTSGCTVQVRPAPPPLAMAPAERPALVDEYGSFSKEGRAWLQNLVNAYLRNCVTLKVLRGEDPMTCDQGLR